ncbi:MAG: 1,4-dihydroxy-2-naphthoate octaprenyltransferase [Cellulomonadaceae bacterium TMED98]|nr:MAG: 1,4-dihydroxy-2-naphthoate octaprenyltransferase [Cellulomonadaceae bacterium TMED98]
MTATPSSSSVTVWLTGARLRTLPLAFGPVLLGSASAWTAGSSDPLRASLALLVAVSLQIGVNYANDYSDGIRGTDDYRVGPPRLTGSGLVRPGLVKRAAFLFFAVAVAAGGALILLAGAWWLIVVGALAVWAAWSYTGGTRPYGYRGLGELVVFIFFGPVATAGTAYVQAGFVPWESLVTGSAMGFFAAAVLMINNLRDIEPDEQAGKHTLSVQIGAKASKAVITLFLGFPYLLLLVPVGNYPSSPLVLFTSVLVVVVGFLVWTATRPARLIRALQITSAASLLFAASLSAVMVLG